MTPKTQPSLLLLIPPELVEDNDQRIFEIGCGLARIAPLPDLDAALLNDHVHDLVSLGG